MIYIMYLSYAYIFIIHSSLILHGASWKICGFIFFIKSIKTYILVFEFPLEEFSCRDVDFLLLDACNVDSYWSNQKTKTTQNKKCEINKDLPCLGCPQMPGQWHCWTSLSLPVVLGEGISHVLMLKLIGEPPNSLCCSIPVIFRIKKTIKAWWSISDKQTLLAVLKIRLWNVHQILNMSIIFMHASKMHMMYQHAFTLAIDSSTHFVMI